MLRVSYRHPSAWQCPTNITYFFPQYFCLYPDIAWLPLSDMVICNYKTQALYDLKAFVYVYRETVPEFEVDIISSSCKWNDVPQYLLAHVIFCYFKCISITQI